MHQMLSMYKRVTIRTQRHQIFKSIIFSIFINVVHAKNFLKFIITTLLTFINQTSYEHSFTNSCKFRQKSLFQTFINTLFTAIFALSARTIFKFFAAIYTRIRTKSSAYLRFIIAFCRAIFRFVYPRTYVIKFISACFTISSYKDPLVKSFAFQGKKFRNVSTKRFDTIGFCTI